MELFRMPQAGWTMKSAEIVQWLKRETEPVTMGEPLLELETDKTVVEVESPLSGVLVRVLVGAGESVEVGVPLAVIAHQGEAVAPEAVEAFVKQRVPLSGKEAQVPMSVSQQVASAAAPKPAPASEVRAAPRVRKLAQELGVDLTIVSGSGAEGAVLEEDVRRQATGLRSPNVRQKVALTGVRKAMAAHTLHSWQSVPHFHQIVDVNAERLLHAHKEQQVSLTVLFVRAAAIALVNHPWINATIDGNEVSLLADVNIGVAVDTEKGLVVPVVRNAVNRSLKELASELDRLSALARVGKLSQDDLVGGTFTVSNLGMFGIDTGTPVINAPQVALMFIGSVRHVPAVRGSVLVEVPRVMVTFSYDHRVVDGVTAARFSKQVRELLEAAETL